MRGGQHQVLLLVEGMRQRGHENVVLARKRSAMEGDTEAGIETGLLDCSKREKLQARRFGPCSRRKSAHVSCCCFPLSFRRIASSRISAKQSCLPDGSTNVPHDIWRCRSMSRMNWARAGISRDRIDVIYDAVPEVDCGTWDASAPAVALASHDP